MVHMSKSKNSYSKGLYDIKITQLIPYFILPVFLYIMVVVLPIINAGYFSLQNTMGWNRGFYGLNNYKKLLLDEVFWLSLKNNIYFIIISILFQVGPAVILCTLFIMKKVYQPKFVRALFFFPCIISSIVTAYIWKIMYNNQYGLVNYLFDTIGLGSLKQNWLADPKVVLTSISIPLAWQYIGLYLIILLAGATNINSEIFEVAQIDGASGSKMLFKIVLPLLKNSINVSLIMCISGGIKIFDQVYALTNGGPGYASTVLAQYAFKVSFDQANYGYGATISIAMLIISFLLIAVMSKLRQGGENDE